MNLTKPEKFDRSIMTMVLNRLNQKWELDFVSSTMGTCCHTCADFGNPEIDKAYEDAEIYLIISYFTEGMNYRGKFEEQAVLTMNYDLPENLTIPTVCADLQEALLGQYSVMTPQSDRLRIALYKDGTVFEAYVNGVGTGRHYTTSKGVIYYSDSYTSLENTDWRQSNATLNDFHEWELREI